MRLSFLVWIYDREAGDYPEHEHAIAPGSQGSSISGAPAGTTSDARLDADSISLGVLEDADETVLADALLFLEDGPARGGSFLLRWAVEAR